MAEGRVIDFLAACNSGEAEALELDVQASCLVVLVAVIRFVNEMVVGGFEGVETALEGEELSSANEVQLERSTNVAGSQLIELRAAGDEIDHAGGNVSADTLTTMVGFFRDGPLDRREVVVVVIGIHCGEGAASSKTASRILCFLMITMTMMASSEPSRTRC
jgi:hypothetical protein